MKDAIRMLVRAEKGAIIGWSIGLGALALLVVASFPAIAGDDTLDELWESYPEGVREAFGGAGSISQIDGYMDSQLFTILPIIMGIHVVIHASRSLAGAEENGRLDLLLSTPLRRDQLAIAHMVVVFGVQAVIAVAIGVVLVIGALLFDIDVHLGKLMLGCLNVLPAVWMFCGVTMLASAWGHRRGVPVLVGTLLIAVSYFIGIFAAIVEALEPLRWLSITWHFGESKPLGDGLDPVYYILGLAIAFGSAALAVWQFDRKDITG